MTQETAVARFDYSKPPPGYAVEHSRRTHDFGIRVGWWWKHIERWVAGSLGDAWVHYKERNDPPGMRVVLGLGVWGFDVFRWRGLWVPNIRDGIWDETAARAAAWAWHDRRLALASRLAQPEMLPKCPRDPAAEAMFGTAAWPRCLTWSDEQVAEVERWLVDSTDEMPEVLRGSANRKAADEVEC